MAHILDLILLLTAEVFFLVAFEFELLCVGRSESFRLPRAKKTYI
jgi:hypothetical protein